MSEVAWHLYYDDRPQTNTMTSVSIEIAYKPAIAIKNKLFGK